jgi:hypothetical protein
MEEIGNIVVFGHGLYTAQVLLERDGDDVEVRISLKSGAARQQQTPLPTITRTGKLPVESTCPADGAVAVPVTVG